MIGALNDGVGQVCPRYSPDGLWLAHLQSKIGGLIGDPDLEMISLVRRHVDNQGRPNPAVETLTVIEGSSSGLCGQMSPDGQAIAVLRVADNGDLDVAIVSIDDRTVVLLDASPASPSMSWSPAGDFLAIPTEGGIAVVDITTGEISIVPTSATPNELSWSPDGQRFAFTGIAEGDRTDLFLVGREGTDEIRLTEGDEWESSPSWSSQGDLAMIQMDCPPLGECQSHTVLYENGSFTVLQSARIEETLSTQVLGPLVWSPDGRWILHLISAPVSLPGQPLVATPLIGVPRVVTIEFGINSYDWQRR